MAFVLDFRKQYYEVESVKNLEEVLPDIVIESLNYCARQEQPFTPTYAVLSKDKVTVHFLVDFDNMVVYFDILRSDKNIDCAAAPLRQFMSGEHNIAAGPLAHLICEEIQRTVNMQNWRDSK